MRGKSRLPKTPRREPASFARPAALTKSFSGPDEAGLKQTPDMVGFDQTMRFGHVGTHHSPGLRPVLQELPRGPGQAPTSVDLRPERADLTGPLRIYEDKRKLAGDR